MFSGLLPAGSKGILAGRLILGWEAEDLVLSERATGPVVWSRDGLKLDFAQCGRDLFKKPFQRIVVMDISMNLKTVYH